MFTLCLLFLLGVCGLAIDVGRMYVTKSEAQSFADAAALNATLALAGHPGDFTAATAAVANTDKKWEFGTQAFTNVTTTFGASQAGVFTATPPASGLSAADYTFVRVTAQVNLSMYLMGAAIGRPKSSISAQAMAGLKGITSMSGGEFPASPWSRKNANPESPSDPFGFKVGNQYTLRWSPPGDKSSCGTDEGNVGDNGSYRGYCCTGSSSAVSVRDVLAGEGTVPVSVGDAFQPLITPGQKNSIDITDFIKSDTDANSANYAAYRRNNMGNNKRIVIVPVNRDLQTVVGFAAFFLLPAAEYNGKDWCGEYLGSYVQGMPTVPPGAGHGVYRLQLFE